MVRIDSLSRIDSHLRIDSFHFVLVSLVLVYKWGTEKIWGICGEFVDKINTFPTNCQYIIHKIPTQLKINCFPIKYLKIIMYFNKLSLFFPLPNQHFFNWPTFCQQTFLNRACRLSKFNDARGNMLSWVNRWENVEIYFLDSDLQQY